MKPEIVYGFGGAAQDMVAKKATQLFLLAKKGDIEVIKQTIAQNKPFALTPGQTAEAFEFVYILDGKIQQTPSGKELQAGDFLVVHGLDNAIYFQTLTPVTLLFITNSPVFYDQKTRIQHLLSLTKEVEEKDQQTEAHCYRLQEIAAKMGQKLGLSDENVYHLVYAAVLHDVGKKNVPDNVLKKPGPLTDGEWEMIRQHPGWGQSIILEHFGESEFSRVAQIVVEHHERYDGTGYPKGLARDAILLEAQILAIIDAYDAMISSRPYKGAGDHEDVCASLEQERGKQFSPTVLDAFLDIAKSFQSGRNTADSDEDS